MRRPLHEPLPRPKSEPPLETLTGPPMLLRAPNCRCSAPSPRPAEPPGQNCPTTRSQIINPLGSRSAISSLELWHNNVTAGVFRQEGLPDQNDGKNGKCPAPRPSRLLWPTVKPYMLGP
jgi:hypothetical protein